VAVENRYTLQLIEGAGGINQTNEIERSGVVACVQSTPQVPGTAAVLSVKYGAARLSTSEKVSQRSLILTARPPAIFTIHR
jgi:hypothetical protein